ncbi:type II secretion system F family protein [Ureibacillus chungkukjangi]|uniref:Tight adherence protein B n=1 Tax=Ureibacillus chungkukjangi TaxID=1202712 RepID=A0A318TXA1_9BACL|nr:type II secretion system F family protein [Ureibacillus chungkukjangi]PYF07638.1 tight adherence protein B [Ureibacillus chungkukjangi]
MTTAAIAFGAVLLFIFGFYNLLGYRKEKKEWRKKTHQFYREGEKRKSVLVLWGSKFDQTETAKEMEGKLQDANIPFTPSEFCGALIVSYMGILFVLVNFFDVPPLIGLVLSLLLLEAGRRMLFKIRKDRRRQILVDQLPDICRLLANSTRSGMTLNQGIQLVAKEMAEPAKSEFKNLAHELSLGIDFGSAIRALEKRIDNKEFHLFTATLLIQKRAGGNLYAVLDEMSQTLDDRKLLKQEIKTMTAEHKYIAYIVPVIPIFLVLMMNNVVDGFLDSLFTGIGLILFAIFVTGTVATFFIINKITNIRV